MSLNYVSGFVFVLDRPVPNDDTKDGELPSLFLLTVFVVVEVVDCTVPEVDKVEEPESESDSEFLEFLDSRAKHNVP